MIDYAKLTTALELALASRRDAQAELDAANLVQVAAAQGASEEEVQTLAALVRQLDTAARELQAALKTGNRQLVEVRARKGRG
jgi:hypothetical protein